MPSKTIIKEKEKPSKKETKKDKIICIKDKEFTFSACLKETKKVESLKNK
jgi:hypothetical protein